MPKATAQELLEKRNNALQNMRNTMDRAKKEGRNLTPAEETEYSGWERETVQLKAEYDSTLKMEERDKKLKEEESRLEDPANVRQSRNSNNPNDRSDSRRGIITWSSTTDLNGGSARSRRHNNRRLRIEAIRRTQAYAANFAYSLVPEAMKQMYLEEIGEQSSTTTLQTDDDVRAGYLAPSEQFMEGLLKEVDDATWIWKNSRVIIVPKAQTLGIRKRTGKMSTWAKGSELSDATDNLDESLAFGRKNLTPSYFTGSARLSRDLIRSSVIDIESMVYSEFARDLGEVIEAEDISGNGDGGPLGVMVASPDGISTARDISTGNTTTAFTPETFYEAKYNMKVQYRGRCRWMFQREIVRDIMKLRDDSGASPGTGTFLMQPAIRAGEPDTLLGLPIDENEFFPNARGASLYFGLLAVWEYYVHAIALDMEIQRLDQTRAKTNEIEYVGRVKLDGMPILEEAFTRLQFAAS